MAIDRNDPAGSILKIKEFAHFIQNNFAIVIYPEGSRNIEGKVQKFKTSGIEAILQVMPTIEVIPIAIKNTAKIDNSGKFLKKLGSRFLLPCWQAEKLIQKIWRWNLNKFVKK